MKRISAALAGALLTTVLTATGAGAATTPAPDPTGAPDQHAADEYPDRPSPEELQEGGAQMGWSLKQEQDNQPRSFARQSRSVPSGTKGIDVSNYQASINWARQAGNGVEFAYIKATEGDYYTSPAFNDQYTGAYAQGIIRGAYHFGNPDMSGGAEQARYFVRNGGGWSSDGKTLPGVLDIEYDPYGDDNICYGQSPRQLVNWIDDFVDTYRALTGRNAVIYTNNHWWRTCTNNSTAFDDSNPLWVARYSSQAGTLPAGWSDYTIWQYTSKPFDHDVFNGSVSELRAFADSCRSPLAGGRVFCDVAGDYIFGEEIAWLADQGITTGYDDGDFNPSRRITREAMAAFMYRYAGEPAYDAPSNSPFSDVDPGDPFYKEIAWLAEQDITTGYEDGTYRPRNKISREAMAAFLYRYEGVSNYSGDSGFTDVPDGYIFAEEIAWLADQDITHGYDDGGFHPRSRISREATAAFLYRLDQL